MTKYLYTNHKCSFCNKGHYCPDGCWEHKEDGTCKCNDCGMRDFAGDIKKLKKGEKPQ